MAQHSAPPPHSFADRVVLITGAASGIGRQLALVLAAEGARIGALDWQVDSLEALTGELKGRGAATAVADVTDATATARAVADLESRLGPADVLIASAGVGLETSALDFRPEDFATTVSVNLTGVANSFAAVLPGMRQRRQGHLVALSSLASYRGLPRMAAYCASKSGVNALCEAFRVELKPFGIAVTTICPGFIRTPMTTNLKTSLPMLSVEEAVARMVPAIRRRRPFVAFAASGLWQARLGRYLPRAVVDWLTGRIARRLDAS
jgi:NAD(P)-dependent dehydrogenase (short-subunit alcohol dehydrogenase family)